MISFIFAIIFAGICSFVAYKLWKLDVAFEVFAWNQQAWFDKLDTTLEKAMLDEEVAEFQKALEERDDVEVMDGACDSIYIILGTLYKYWFTEQQFVDCMDEVIKSNNSKLPFTRDENWKVKKWPNFIKPNIAKHLLP